MSDFIWRLKALRDEGRKFSVGTLVSLSASCGPGWGGLVCHTGEGTWVGGELGYLAETQKGHTASFFLIHPSFPSVLLRAAPCPRIFLFWREGIFLVFFLGFLEAVPRESYSIRLMVQHDARGQWCHRMVLGATGSTWPCSRDHMLPGMELGFHFHLHNLDKK